MDEANLWGLLVNAGIVTITKEIEEDYYRLRVPNLEVWKVFKELTACHLKIDERHMEKMLNALKKKGYGTVCRRVSESSFGIAILS